MKTTIGMFFAAMLAPAFSFGINCQRILTVVSGNEVKVEITVSKDDVTGIARLSEMIPQGAKVKYAKSEGGTFDVVDNKIKFFWMSLPAAEKVTVAYILSTEQLHEGDYSLTGKFSYISGTIAHVIDIDPTLFNLSAGGGIKLQKSQPLTASLVNTKGPTGKVTYGVQVASTQKQLPANYFSSQYNINDPVKIENADGQFKYVLGEFSDLNAANTFREALVNKGIKDSFTVAFLNSQRISLNEAKMQTAAANK